MKAIILAGGLGTRLRPLTDNTPKPLLPIHGRPILEHAILNFKKHGIKDIILSVGHLADKIEAHFGNGEKLGVNISYSIEAAPLGTGGALKQAARGITETFVAINGDNLADFDWTALAETHKKNNATITLALFPVEDVSQFGIARVEDGRIMQFVEKPKPENAPSNLNNAGGYMFEPDALEILPEGVSSIERDCFEKLAELGVLYAHLHDLQWFPTDNLERFRNAEENFVPNDHVS
ncbi:MAG: nucleotidyltransferase family protein [bacterium]|nr:nucleotidyltransferase family protein [bacterium]